MPIYDYKCKKCGNEIEIIHKSDDTSVRKCNACGETMERAIGAVAVIFKGSGFHKNDYNHGASGTTARTASENTAKKSGNDSNIKDAAKTESKSDTSSAPTDKSAAGVASAKSESGKVA